MQVPDTRPSLSRRQLLRHGALGALIVAAGSRPALAALTTMRMSCWSQPLSEQTNVFAAQEFGWFREAGLDFTFVPGAGGGAAVALAGEVLTAIAKGPVPNSSRSSAGIYAQGLSGTACRLEGRIPALSPSE